MTFPKSKLEIEEGGCSSYKYGFDKYFYHKDTQEDMKVTIEVYKSGIFPNSKISYFT